MLLRSSSAPPSQTLFSDRDFNPITNNNRTHHNCLAKISFSRICCKTFRRAQSDSNLDSFNIEEIYKSTTLRTGAVHKPMLHTEPSFSIYNSDYKLDEEIEKKLDRSATVGDQFSFGGNDMLMIKEVDEEEERGLDQFNIENRDESSEVANSELEEYYNKMVREDPSNPLVLRNYAQFLESKRDFSGAEEYYFRATLADPKDGEIMSRYARLVWDLHRNQARASTYFEMAAKAAPQDSHVLAAYASFLWDTDKSEEENGISESQVDENVYKEEMRPSSPPLHLAMGLGINMSADYMNTGLHETASVEEYYRKMVEENPCNPLFMRNYAQFLHQSMGNLSGAEEYYSRAILLDPSDGQILSLYADVVWQLHRDKDRAAAYFERAVEATPTDSNVLGAYAKFLWETEDEVAEGAIPAHANA